jgi:aromatic ring-opening dioxygenase catalytic subunit (LigB family)
MYAPFVVAYPDADMPIVQVSLRHDYDPEFHLQVGQALAPLRDEGVLIVGSGLTYHNLRLFDARAAKPSREFDAWLQRAVVESVSASRSSLLLDWEAAPSARIAHPQEDHLLPLMVAVGAAEEERGQMVYHEEDFMGGVCASSFRFG